MRDHEDLNNNGDDVNFYEENTTFWVDNFSRV